MSEAEDILARMTITLYRNGQIVVEGIPAQGVTAYGLLGVATEIVHEQRRRKKADEPQVEVPRMIVPRAG